MSRGHRSGTRQGSSRATVNRSRWVEVSVLILGVLALFAGTLATAEWVGQFSSRGMLTLLWQERLRILRLLAMVVGSFLVVGSSWRLRGKRVSLIVLAASLAWSLALVNRLYPNHLFFQPARLIQAGLGEEMLLSDYAPRQRLVLPAHEVLRARYPVINIHAHFRRGHHWTPEQMIGFMDACNIERTNDLDGELGKRMQEEFTQYAAPHPDRFTIFATVWYPLGPIDWGYFHWSVEHLAEAKRMGAKGIKMWKNLGLTTLDEHRRLIPVDDPRLDSVWAKAGELKLPILIHLGDPQAFFDPIDKHNERYEELKAHPDWSFYGPQYPSLETVLAQFERVVTRHPEVTFVLAHLGNRTDDLREAAGLLNRHPNLYMDIAARVSELGRQPAAARDFLIRYQDRVLFGTDGNPGVETYRSYFRFFETTDEYFNYPFWPQDNYGRWKIYGIALPDDVLRKLYHDNAARLLGLPLLADVKRR